MKYTMKPWDETIEAMHSGEMIEIDEEVFDYFLGVLPPVYKGRRMLIGGRLRTVSFGFAEGYEPITAFWLTREFGPLRYFCQRTGEMNCIKLLNEAESELVHGWVRGAMIISIAGARRISELEIKKQKELNQC